MSRTIRESCRIISAHPVNQTPPVPKGSADNQISRRTSWEGGCLSQQPIAGIVYILMVNRIARIVLGVMLAGVSTVAGDVVETTDGRRLEGGVRFADGAVYVTTEQGPARLRIDEIAVLRRHHADADQPAGVATGVIPPDGLM